MKKQPAKGHTAKHSHTKKHHHHPKKHHPTRQVQGPTHHHHQKVHTAAKGAKGHKPRGLALGEAVACCTAEALAASLRLTGRPVGAGDVLALHVAAGGSQDVGVPILAALEAACEWGLAGVRPVSFARRDLELASLLTCGDADCVSCSPRSASRPEMLLVGLELPGPHTVCADGGWWFSWGDRWPPSAWPDAVIEEAWGIRWP